MKNKSIYLLIASTLLLSVSCNKEKYDDLIPVEMPTEIASTIIDDYVYYDDDYHDGSGYIVRDCSFVVTQNSYIHPLQAYKQILYYPEKPNWFRLHDTTVAISDHDNWLEFILVYEESGTSGNWNYHRFKHINFNEEHHIRWFFPK